MRIALGPSFGGSNCEGAPTAEDWLSGAADTTGAGGRFDTSRAAAHREPPVMPTAKATRQRPLIRSGTRLPCVMLLGQMGEIEVIEARQHNLKGVSCRLPKNQLTVITGPSGSGKSSLAFDTLYAEGQRRYVEALSPHARQFLERLPRPDVERIDGLTPAIAIKQQATATNPRSTLGTTSEVSDYLRLLFARVGTPHCPVSGKVLRAYTPAQIVQSVLDRGLGTKVMVLAPVLRQFQGDLDPALSELRADGFVRARLDGTVFELSEPRLTHADSAVHLEVVVDRLVVRDGIRSRLSDSIELALSRGSGTVLLDYMQGDAPTVMSDHLVSWEHGVALPRLEPRLFSFNSPQGACPECSGLGTRSQIAKDRVVGDEGLSLREGALAIFGRPGSVARAIEVSNIVKALGADPDVPWRDLPPTTRETILHQDHRGAKARAVAGDSKARRVAYLGVVPRLEERLAQLTANANVAGKTSSTDDADYDDLFDGSPNDAELSQFLVSETCPSCRGTRLRREALSVRIGGQTIALLCSMPLSELLEFFRTLPALLASAPTDLAVALPLLRELEARLGFLLNVGLHYVTLARATSSLSAGELQRVRLATQIGAALVGVLYVLDEPSAGLHPRDNAQLLTAIRALVYKGNSVVMVEHDRDAILGADYLIDMGPGAGDLGGQILAQGRPEEVLRSPSSCTAPYLTYRKRLAGSWQRKEPGARSISLRGAKSRNLKNVSCEIPLGLLTVVTGVSGSGKSSLIMDTLLAYSRRALYHARGSVGECDGIDGIDLFDKVISIDQSPIGRSPRSTP
ncbi:MAG: hypothetical protein RJA70_2120, partial [Pseudomonadota bacterium]